MKENSDILLDQHGRKHTYLRISLTEKCNLRCTYCMPENGIALSPQRHLMTTDEIIQIAQLFVQYGVTKIRLTGGEPLVRKDFSKILQALSELPVQLSLTTNAVLLDKYFQLLKSAHIKELNVSLDSLQADKFLYITRRDQFQKAYKNIKAAVTQGFNVKLNVVLIKGFNDDEIVDFVELTRNQDITIRFIEFMPFDGNSWNKTKLVTEATILDRLQSHYKTAAVHSLPLAKNFIARNYSVDGFKGRFGIISTVTNPFCDQCNRIRLTADGKIKNCLFSNNEIDLLSAYREGKTLTPVIQQVLQEKHPIRAGMSATEDFTNTDNHTNRSMIAIGG